MEEFSYNENVASKLLEGFNDFDLKNHQFVFLFNQLINNKNNINKAIEEFNPDGIIIAYSYTKKIDINLNNLKINKILLNCYSDNFNGLSILPDDYNGAKKAINYLLNNKLKNIPIILSSDPWMKGYKDRLSGWRDAHTENNIKYDNKIIIKPASNLENVGYVGTKKLLKKNKKIDAIFCTSDEIAIGAYQAIKEEGLNIPQDISIVGFDNSRLSVLVKPTLTTVQLPYSAMTQKAIQHIIDPQKFNDNFNILVESPLIIRESIKVKK
jgi:LacI family transcriptional regulator